MKLMRSAEYSQSPPVIAVLLILLLFVAGAEAQTRKSAKASAPRSKKVEKNSSDAKKESKKKTAEKDSAKKMDTKAAARTRESTKEREARKKLEEKKKAEARAAEAERRRRDEERRQAILAERRRREQVAREARERKLAFERGLRTETVENIGDDRTEGEDLNIRRAAVQALGSHAGTVVVMEAQTGKVVTIVNQDWAIRDSFKPCSTIKLVTGVAGLNEDLIDSDGNIRSASSRLDLNDALAYSNNAYFQRVGVNMGSNKLISYAKGLGLGSPTGINADGEVGGRLPYGNNNARIYSHGDDFEVTPLQLAVMVSAISNGGNVVVPHIPRSGIEKVGFRGPVRRKIDLPGENLRGVIPGMIGAAEYGTARKGVDSSMGVAGKTGSCIGKGTWVGLFASFAPIERPEYAVVVITRGQSERGKYAAAIAGKVYDALAPRLRRTPAEAPIFAAAKPKPKVDDRTRALYEEEEDDNEREVEVSDADAAATAAAEQLQNLERTSVPIIVGKRPQPIIVQNRPDPSIYEENIPKSQVRKIVDSRAISKPVIISFRKDGVLTDREQKPKPRPRIVKNK
ncbi:MAG: penicillin-binding transpeptidase domain-containing protein [Pyrinomonadaceae bacterium]